MKTTHFAQASLLASFFALATTANASGILSDNYSADKTFQDALDSTTMTLAFDGSSYFTSSGGSPSGARYAQYDSAGTLVSTFSPGLDFRSVFTAYNGGDVYARQFSDSTVYK